MRGSFLKVVIPVLTQNNLSWSLKSGKTERNTKLYMGLESLEAQHTVGSMGS